VDAVKGAGRFRLGADRGGGKTRQSDQGAPMLEGGSRRRGSRRRERIGAARAARSLARARRKGRAIRARPAGGGEAAGGLGGADVGSAGGGLERAGQQEQGGHNHSRSQQAARGGVFGGRAPRSHE